MALILTTTKTSVEIHLQDISNLIFSDTSIEEAIRSALRAMSRVYETALTLNGLDGAVSNNFDETDNQVLIDGAVAYSLVFRAIHRFDEATSETDLPPDFSSLAQARMNDFYALLTQVELRILGVSVHDHTHELAMLDDKQAHDLAVIAAKHANQLEIISDANDREDAAKAAEIARLTELQESEDHPYSQWEWDEGDDFA